jgi:hypothetical protein
MLTWKGSLAWRTCVGVADALVSVASVVSVAIDIGYRKQELALNHKEEK